VDKQFDTKIKFGDVLAQTLRKYNKKHKDLSRKVGCSQTAIGAYCAKKYLPSKDILKLFKGLQSLGVGVRELSDLLTAFEQDGGKVSRELRDEFEVEAVGEFLLAKPPIQVEVAYAQLMTSWADDFARSNCGGNEGGSKSIIHDPGLCLGREDEVDQLVSNLVSVSNGASILVLGGPGVGKTTLTEKVGTHPKIVEIYGERRWFIELETSDSARSALAAIAEGIDLERTAPFAAVSIALGRSAGLLVLTTLKLRSTSMGAKPQFCCVT